MAGKAPKFRFGMGTAEPLNRGPFSDWPGNYGNFVDIEIPNMCVLSHFGMRFNGSPPKDLLIKFGLFTEKDDKPSKLVSHIECKMDGTETGPVDFLVKKKVPLKPGKYFVVFIPNGSLRVLNYGDGKQIKYSSNCWDLFERDAPPTSYTTYPYCFGVWCGAEDAPNRKDLFLEFANGLQNHLKPPPGEKHYFPPFPDGWEEADLKLEIFHVAVQLGLEETVKWFLDQVKPDVTSLKIAGQNALHVASFHDRSHLVSCLLEAKAELESRTSDQAALAFRTSLLLACEQGAKTTLASLLAAKADLHALDDQERHGLLLASAQGRGPVVDALLEAKAVVDHRDILKSTSLLEAIRNKHVDICRTLLKVGADVHVVDKTGRNAMHLVAVNNSVPVLDVILEAKGGDLIELADTQNQTPLDIAAERKSAEVAAVFMRVRALMGGAASWGITTGDGARHRNEAGKVSFIKILVPVGGTMCTEIGIRWFHEQWEGKGLLKIALFASVDDKPDLSKVLATGTGVVDAGQDRGVLRHYAFGKGVILSQETSYWAAITSNIDVVLEKDARVPGISRYYLTHSFDLGWDKISSELKPSQCAMALFLQTESAEKKPDGEKKPAPAPAKPASATTEKKAPPPPKKS